MDKSASPLLSLKNELLLNAVVRGELPTVRRLLDRHGADVNSYNSSGMSCLQLAIVNRHSKLAEYLIQKGVDIHKVDSNGWSALHDAALSDNFIIVRKLILKGLTPMMSTDQGELVIDVAGSQQMERLLCEEMCVKGEITLARQYYHYLGLNLTGKPSSAHNSFSKGNRGNLCSYQLPAKDVQMYGSKAALYSRNTSTCNVTNSTSGVCKLSSGVGTGSSSMTLRFHPNSNIEHSLHHSNHAPANTALINGGSQDSRKDARSGEYKTRAQTADCRQISQQSTIGEAVQSTICSDRDKTEQSIITEHHLTTYESTQANYSKSSHQREGTVINALYQHSSFQLQIGLSLLGLDSQATNLDQDICESTTNKSSTTQDSSNSPKLDSRKVQTSAQVRSHRRATRTQSDPASRDPLQVQFQNPRPPRKVSFAKSSMTGTRRTTTDPTESSTTVSSQGNQTSPLMDNTLPPSTSSDELSTTEVLAQLTEIYKQQIEEEPNDLLEDAGVRALRLQPRKSSIVSPQRRRSSSGRRRSVTFQPEILLHENVISGDAKALSDMLESGMVQDVNKMSPAGLTALHQSAIDGNLDCAKALVHNGAKVNCTDCELWTPLHAAAVTGKVEFVRFLLLSGADSTLKNDNGETAYDITKDNQVRKMLLHSMNGKSPDSNDFSDAEYSGEEEEEYSHAESDSEDETESSELFVTDKHQKPSLKERLGLKHSSALKNVRDLSVSPSPDLDASDSVFVNGHKSPELCNKLNRDINDSTSSYGSIHEPELEDIKELEEGSTTSMLAYNTLASTCSDTEKVSEDQGFSTMEGSSDCSHRSRTLSEDEGTTRDVLDSELVPGSLDYRFQEACLYCDVDSALKLVKHKKEIDVDRVNTTSGITALHHSVLEENSAFVQHLIADFEASVHIQDTDGWTPLHAASAVGNIRIAQLLLENGAKASILNNSCEFPVDVASDEAMEKLLKNVMLGPGVGALFQGVLTR